jgi:hypothetical protein
LTALSFLIRIVHHEVQKMAGNALPMPKPCSTRSTANSKKR